MSVTTVTNALMIGLTPSLRDIISHGVWLSSRFTLSYRDVEELLFARGIMVSHEAIRQWCRKCGQDYAHRLRRRRPQPGASASAAYARSMGAMALTRSNMGVENHSRNISDGGYLRPL
jgi:hypothetical protein